MNKTGFTNICGAISFVFSFGFGNSVEAQDLTSIADCAVISVTTQYRAGNTGGFSNETVQIIPGVGSVWNQQFFDRPIPNRHQSPRNITCQHKKTIPVTNSQMRSALDAHLETINNNIKKNTVEVQQTVAQSFAIQIDVLAAELAEIRSFLSGVDEPDAAALGARLDSLEARLDALSQITNN